jgi:aspartyl-tRNA(Asn)/glutamyl-tRNA(Gln) amidotransferase subunit A
MHQKSLVELSAGLRAGSFSSEELTRACLDRVNRFDGQLNCFISVTEELALEAARAADVRIKRQDQLRFEDAG